MLSKTVTDSQEERQVSRIPPPRRPIVSRGWIQSIAIGLAAAAAVVSIIVSGTWLLGGKSLADRTLTDFAMPVGMLWLGLMVTWVAALMRRRWAFAAFAAALWLAVGVIGNRPLGGQIRQSVEYAATANPADTIDTPLDAVVLLGGYAWTNQFDVPELTGDGQRLMLAAQLWHTGKTKSIICTGTAHFGDRHPSKLGKQLLTSVGVPPEVIFLVPGVNTSGEMRGLKTFFAEPPERWVKLVSDAGEAGVSAAENPAKPDGALPTDPQAEGAGGLKLQKFSVGLVTSAYHLPRALRLAKAQQLNFLPLPCQLSGSPETRFNPQDLIPTAGGAKSMAKGIKEWLARLVGR